MKTTILSLLILSSFLYSCSSPVTALQKDKHENSAMLHEIRNEIADLRHALNNTQVEIQILDEQIKTQEASLKRKQTASTYSNDSKQENKNSSLEKRISLIEQQQGKLSIHANQTSNCLSEYSSKIEEIENTLEKQKKILNEALHIKSTLDSLSNSLEKNEASKLFYIVKSGDSLEKIAKLHKVSLKSIKELNNLTQDRIIIGQKLKIPSMDAL